MCALAVETVRETEQVAHRSVDRRATLMVADGRCFEGRGVGPFGIVGGELVLTTAMTGYQEALTDPSYRGQILMFTYPLIGNYGVLPERDQSGSVHPSGVIFSTLSPTWAGRESLDHYLRDQGVPALLGVDTRAIARAIRAHGAMPAAISVHDADSAPARDRLRAAIDADAYDSTDFVAQTTIAQPITLGTGSMHIVVLDCGNKRDVTDGLLQRDTTVTVVPAS